MKNVAVKATIIVAMETNRDVKPTISLKGSNLRKSLSAYRDVRMDRNINMDVEAANNEIAFDIAKTLKDISLNRIGNPLLSSLPPGKVNAAVKTTVVISVATRVHDSAVFFIHASPCIRKSLCSSVNRAWGVFPDLLVFPTSWEVTFDLFLAAA